MINKYLKLFSCCFVTKGFLRSIIIDTQRLDFYFIPNELFETLSDPHEVPFNYIIDKYGKINEDIINEYVDFLIVNDLAFFTSDPKSFPPISKNWINKRQISNAILDLDENSNYDIQKAIKELDNLNCEAFQIRIFCSQLIKFYKSLCVMLNQTKQVKVVEM